MPFRTIMTTLKARCARFPFCPLVASAFLSLFMFSAVPALRAQCAGSPTTTVSSTDVISTPNAINGGNEVVTTPLTSGGSGVYPSTITVSGVSGTVSCAQIVLENVSSPEDGNSAAESLFDAEVILQSPDNRNFVVMGGVGEPNDYPSNLTLTIGDGYTEMPNNSLGTSLTSSGNYAPTSFIDPADTIGFWDGDSTYPDNPPSPAPPLTLSNYPTADGSATMSSIFSGAQASGGWKLYLVDFTGDPVTINGWELKLWVTPAASTSTTIITDTNPAAPGSSVTYTATVTSEGSPVTSGTVAFYAATNSANNAPAQISSCTAQPINSSGQATCTVTLSAASATACTTFSGTNNTTQSLPAFPSVCQGNQSIYAAYSGSTDYSPSPSPTLTQVIIPTPLNPTGNTWCSSSPITVPYSGLGAAYPAVIPVSGYAAGTTVSTVSVTLNNVQSSSGDDGAFLLVAPGGAQNLDFFDTPFVNGGCSDATLTIDDDAGQYPGQTCPSGSATYSPFDGDEDITTFSSSAAPSAVSAIPAVPGTINYPGPPPGYGSASNTFAAKFNGAPANGDWALYPNSGGGNQLLVNGGWCITLTLNTGVPTTTKITPTANPAPTNTSVTYTASVTSAGSPVTSGGTVTFLDNNTVPGGTVSGNNVVNLSAAGTATFSSSSLSDQITISTPAKVQQTTNIYEGDHTLTASYSGTESDNTSMGTLFERFNNPSTITSTGSNTYQACNAGPIYPGWGSIGPFAPNPSVITVANIPGTVSNVSLTLNNFYYVNDSGGENYPIGNMESLLVGPGPTGAALDFFSGASSSTSLAEGAYTFSDSGVSVPSSGAISPGAYLPTSENSGSDTFVSSASGFYNAPTLTASNYAQPKGSATFASTFGSATPNGAWKLFFNETGYLFGAGAVNGWCVNFTENPATVAVSVSHSGSGMGGDFVQGESGAAITMNVTNTGSGSTGDPTGTNPLKLTDTLNAGLTYTGYSGTGWSCSTSGQTVTCTNDSAVAQGGGTYPALTLNANVSSSLAGSFTNTASVSGAGAAGSVGSDTINVDTAPVLLVNLADSGGFKQGGTGQWIVTVSNAAANGATNGVVTVTDALPAGYTLASYTSTSDLWTCSGTNAVICTASPGISAGVSSTISLTVNIPANSPALVGDLAQAYGGGDLVHTSPATADTSNTDTVSVAPGAVATTLTLSANQSSIVYGRQVTLTATLSPYTNESYSNNGEAVTFINGSTTLGTGTLNNGVATLTTAALPEGSDSITASYPGDANFLASSATAIPVSVTAPNYVVTVAGDDTGTAANCTPQSSATIGTDASCSLRDALLAAANAGGANISFSTSAFSSAQTITLSSGTLTIPTNTTITGVTTGSGAALANLVTVSGNNASTVFTVSSGTTGAAIANLGITHGSGASGGGISNAGTLRVTGSALSANQSTGSGGGIYNAGTLTVAGSAFSANIAAANGGGIDNEGTLSVTGSTFAGNSAGVGGAINSGSTASVAGSTFSANTATTSGGISIAGGALSLANSIVSGNTAGSTEDDIDGSGLTDQGGNLVGSSGIRLAPLGNYGGPTQTMIPLPGSPAICAGLASNLFGSTDQRGLPDKNTAYAGYSAGAPCVDSGAVQTSYALSFTTQPSSVAAGATMSPVPAVTLTESGAAFADGADAISIPLTLTGAGALSGGTASTDASLTSATKGVASYSSLSVSATGTGDTLTATLSLNPNLSTPLSLTANSGSFNVTAALQATQEISAASLTENHAASAFTPVIGSGGTGTLTYSISPSLPAGLSINASTGAISGTPTVTSSSMTYTVTVTDQDSATASETFVLAVNGPLQATTSIASKSLTVNVASPSFTPVTGSGGTGTLTYSISPPLPAGLSISASTGAISGTPTATSTATSYTVTVTDQNSATANASFSLTVNKATPTVSAWPTASAIPYGQTLANSTLTGGSASVAGAFTWASPGTVPGAGAPSESVLFTPADTAHYTTVAGMISVTVNKAVPVLHWSAPASIVYGTALSAAQLNATASVAGSFIYTPAAGTVLAAGPHMLSAGFTPADTNDYSTPQAATTSITVTDAPLSITANNATKIYGTANPAFSRSVTGAVNNDSFTASYTTAATQSSPAGNYAIVPAVSGANLGDYTVSAANGTLSITQAASSLALAASASSLTPGQSLTLTAAISDTTPNSIGTPTGSVTFLDGTTPIGTVALNNGVATLSVSTLAAGVSHSISANYAGDANFAGSSASPPVTVTVTSEDFTFTPPANTSLTATPGGTATINFTIAPLYGGYAGPVTFSASGLPFGATASFSPSSIPAGAAAQQAVTMTIHLPKPVGYTQRASREWRSAAPLALGLLLMPFAALRRLRKSLLARAGMLVLLFAAGALGAASLSGCASPRSFSEPVQSYIVTVTAQAGSVTHSFQVNLDLQ